ncbi:MAG: hypothetical protein H0X01_08040 [Nitrospira sp.]|nr:hypothetical protein [Nitrospira sp.]
MRLAELVRNAVVAVGFIVMGACAPAKVTTAVSPALDQYQVRSVVIMPFERLATPQILDSPDTQIGVPGGARRSDIQIAVPPAGHHLDRETTTVPAFVPEKISQILYLKLKKRQGFRVVTPEEAVAAMQASGNGAIGVSSEQRAKEVVKRTGADAALLGRVLIYRERDGSRWGAIPAVVGFEVKLMASDGVTLWTANYYEKQRPLTEDLIGFWQHGFGFVTAEELTEYGAERIVRELPFGTL